MEESQKSRVLSDGLYSKGETAGVLRIYQVPFTPTLHFLRPVQILTVLVPSKVWCGLVWTLRNHGVLLQGNETLVKQADSLTPPSRSSSPLRLEQKPSRSCRPWGGRDGPSPGAGTLASVPMPWAMAPSMFAVQLTDDLVEPVIVRLNARAVQALPDVLGAGAGGAPEGGRR